MESEIFRMIGCFRLRRNSWDQVGSVNVTDLKEWKHVMRVTLNG